MASNSADLYWRWVLACTVGEIIGFVGLPVLAGAAVLALTGDFDPALRSIILYATSAVGGLGEGAVLALFQLRVLRRHLTHLDGRRWVLYTACAASFAWLCGMLAPLLDDLFGLTPATQIAIWLPASVLILLSIGTAQSWVLRDVIKRPHRWIMANVTGWLLGLPWTFLLPALLPDNAPMPVWLSTFLVAGVLMGLTVGLVTGRLVIKLQELE